MSESIAFFGELALAGTSYTWGSSSSWPFVLSDIATGVAYFFIPLTLLYSFLKRPFIPFRKLAIAFSVFMTVGGLMYLSGAWVIWSGHYNAYQQIKLFTAVATILSAGTLCFIMPRVLTLPSPLQFKRANELLRREIAERKRTQQRFEKFFDSAPDATVIVDHNSKIIFANAQAEVMSGYTREELVGQSVEILFPERFAKGHAQERDLFLSNPAPRPMGTGREIYGLTKDGKEFPVEMSLGSVGTADEPLMSASVRDISKRKKMEAQSRELQRELAHVTRVTTMGQMAAGLAHELNQPLTAITLNTDAAKFVIKQKSNSDPEMVEILQDIEDEARRAGEIIRALRELVRKGDGDKTRIDLNGLIQQTVLLLEPEARDSNIQIEVDAGNIPDLTVDRVQIAQVLVNLVRNSVAAIVTAGSPTRKIKVKTAVRDEHVLVSVSDSGPGLDANIQVFAPFETSKSEGMGMGLAISRSIIESHGGRLWAENEQSNGAQFLFTLPGNIKMSDYG